ncbi:hypothetical protein HGRIS_009148 [Hohenbuehelia grisea]|uniref:Uncharacterized protein n=1 Tax=Hohenbuehelia grisea TaxID=104357 RepID=A0ABR3J096_9AGAR
MNLSVDDLVASLSSSHVGQEATDIAALQVQLAQTLPFTQVTLPVKFDGHQAPSSASYVQPCNTPTSAHTPSPSLSFNHRADAQLPSVIPGKFSEERVSTARPEVFDELDGEEMMVEDFLPPIPLFSAPTPSQSATHLHHPRHFHQHHQQSQPSSSAYPTYGPFCAADLSQSSFTTTDPFYQQAVHNLSAPPPVSVFSRAGYPTCQSPFLAKERQT